jgi:TonB family protein
MQAGRDARSTAMALLAHAAAIALVFWAVATHVQFAAPVRTAALTELTPPPAMAPAKDVMGGGGGQHNATPVSKGALPKIADRQITPPKAPPMEQPKIRMPDATIEVQKDLKMASNAMPNLGMPSSALMGASMGSGNGTGLGSGSGSGLGPGSGGGFGGGLRTVGGGVSAPVLLYQVEPEFSEEARKAKASGNVLVNLVVDQQGHPQNVHVLRGVGMGLDEKAIAAVKLYKFKPAMEGGKAVAEDGDLLHSGTAGLVVGLESVDEGEEFGLAALAEVDEGDAEDAAVAAAMADRAECAEGEVCGVDRKVDEGVDVEVGGVGQAKEAALGAEIEDAPGEGGVGVEAAQGGLPTVAIAR